LESALQQEKLSKEQIQEQFMKEKEAVLQQEKLSREQFMREKEEILREKEELKREKDDIQKRHNDILESIVKGTAGSTTTLNTVNMFYVQNNFTDAHNIEDLMEKPLTQPEIDHINKCGPLSGCLNLIKTRCVDNVEEKKRPFHCVDSARSKYMLKTEDKWTIDNHGKELLNKSLPKIEQQCILSEDERAIASYNDLVKNNKNMLELMKANKSGTSKVIRNLNDQVLLKNVET